MNVRTNTENFNWIDNLTNVEIPYYPHDFPMPDITSSVETSICGLNSHLIGDFRSKYYNVITNYKNNFTRINRNNK